MFIVCNLCELLFYVSVNFVVYLNSRVHCRGSDILNCLVYFRKMKYASIVGGFGAGSCRFKLLNCVINYDFKKAFDPTQKRYYQSDIDLNK